MVTTMWAQPSLVGWAGLEVEGTRWLCCSLPCQWFPGRLRGEPDEGWPVFGVLVFFRRSSSRSLFSCMLIRPRCPRIGSLRVANGDLERDDRGVGGRVGIWSGGRLPLARLARVVVAATVVGNGVSSVKLVVAYESPRLGMIWMRCGCDRVSIMTRTVDVGTVD